MRLQEVARFTQQPRALAEFYARVLGRPMPESPWGAFNFDVDGVNLFIHPVGEEPQQPGWPANVDHIAFEVDDLDVECRRLTELGFQLLGPAEFPWGRFAYLHDPDGRMIELHGRSSPQS